MACRRFIRWLAILICGFYVGAHTFAAAPTPKSTASMPVTISRFVDQNCLECHDATTKTAGLSLESLLQTELSESAESWEKVIRRLRARQMPPHDAARPSDDDYNAVLASLEGELDRAASLHSNPGRTDSIRRLTRSEYKNSILDLLALDIDVDQLLPADESSHGFDNVALGIPSPTLLTRYITAAQKISRLAIGGAGKLTAGATIRVRPDVTQEQHIDGLPLGTRGGVLIPFNFPQDGEYDIEIRLMRDRNELVEGLTRPHEVEVLLDRERVKLFNVKPPKNEGGHRTADAHLALRTSITAGHHVVGVTFLKQPSSLLETKRQPYDAHFNMHRHPRIGPAIYQVAVTGPHHAAGPGDTPSRRRILICYPNEPNEEDDCARRILMELMRRAYRRPVNDDDLRKPMGLYRAARRRHDFDAGIEAALSSVLVSPHFLFRIERDPPGLDARTAYRIGDIELASRLSFFLWNSIPDDELLDVAIRENLSRPDVLEHQVRRMLADERSRSLSSNFAGQWLYLRNLDSATPDLRLFPDFDDNLRQAFRQETELFVDDVVREDRSVLEFLNADYTFLNERLARHYGIPHVYGSRFRRVQLDDRSHRGGLLRHGSILTVTSYATRTSPVIRGNWVLKNLLGLAPPPPPPNIPVLAENTVSKDLSMRERLAQHRADATCASCHDLMDPVGFALENFDAVGRWRDFDGGKAVDADGGLPDGSRFCGVAELEKGLLKHPEMFVSTLVERLFTFALGRGVEYYDAPAIRRIARDAADDNYRWSSLIIGITKSTPFQMRTSP